VIANAWVDAAMQELTQAYDHAWKATILQGSAFDAACIQATPGPAIIDAYWQCLAGGVAVPPEKQAALRSEIEASHGILPIISFDRVARASPQSRPVVWERGVLVLAGALIGLLVGAAGAIAWRQNRGSPETPAPRDSTSQRSREKTAP
jgi:hypothetical protein